MVRVRGVLKGSGGTSGKEGKPRRPHAHSTSTFTRPAPFFTENMSMQRSMPFQRLTDSASRRMRSAGATRAGAAPVTPDRLAASVGSAWVNTSQNTDA
jgi:hypothetical protein